MLFGVNHHIESHAIPGMTAVWRDYPAARGLVTVPQTGLTTFMSVSPDLQAVCDGTLDQELADWLRQLPAGTYVTILDGANAPHLNIDPHLWKQANSRLQSIKSTIDARVQCGYVLDTYPVTRHGLAVDDWIIGHADWAGLIGHQEQPTDTPLTVFQDCLAAITQSPGMPELAIVETGTALDDADAWAEAVLGFALRWVGGEPLDALIWHARPGHSKFPRLPGDAMLERMCREAAWAR